jgi:hypothetical protein
MYYYSIMLERNIVYCTCDINSWTQYKMCYRTNTANILTNIHNHIYNHIFDQFLFKSCTSVVAEYVGKIYINNCIEYPLINIIHIRILTLGVPFVSVPILAQIINTRQIDGLYKCAVINYGAPLHIYKPFCEEHNEQWEMRLNTYFHRRKCNDRAEHVKITYLSIIMKLNTTIYRDTTNHILSFCINDEFYNCCDHELPRSYTCSECQDKCIVL